MITRASSVFSTVNVTTVPAGIVASALPEAPARSVGFFEYIILSALQLRIPKVSI